MKKVENEKLSMKFLKMKPSEELISSLTILSIVKEFTVNEIFQTRFPNYFLNCINDEDLCKKVL